MLNQSSHLLVLAILLASINCRPTVTLVSGFWDVGRGDLGSGFKRTNEYYMGFFESLLKTESNMIIFGDEILQKFVKEKRNQSNTVFILKDLKSFLRSWHTKMVINIIHNLKKTPQWQEYSKFPQFGLEMYNPVVMSKFSLMSEAIKHDIFGSDYLVWCDAGLMHNYQKFADLYIKDNILESFHHIYQLSWYFHLYQDKNMFRGYEKGESRYINDKIPYNEIVWANYFGGRIEAVTTVATVYQNFLRITLEYGDMGTDQSVFSIMLVRYPYLLPIVYDVQMRRLTTERHKILSSQHLLHYDNHRIFRITNDGEYEFIKLSVNTIGDTSSAFWETPETIKQSKVNKSKQVELAPGFQDVSHSLIPQLIAMLSQEKNAYKYIFLHRSIFILILLTLSEYLAHLNNVCQSVQLQ